MVLGITLKKGHLRGENDKIEIAIAAFVLHCCISLYRFLVWKQFQSFVLKERKKIILFQDKTNYNARRLQQ